MGIMRQEWWNPESSMTATFGDRIMGKYAYSEELAGPDGMHIHVWVPPGTTGKELAKIRRHLASERDLVSMSYDYEEAPIEPKGAMLASIEVVQQAVEEQSMKVLKWEGGKSTSLDLFTASAIAKVYEAGGPATKAKIRSMIERSPGGLMKVAEISFSLMR